MKRTNILLLVKEKLEGFGFNVSKSINYDYVIEKNGVMKYVKVVSVGGKSAHWKLHQIDEEVNKNLIYICIRYDEKYLFHIVTSNNISNYIIKYHQSFLNENGINKASNIREFLDRPSKYIPDKIENEYLNNWDILYK